MMRCEADAYGKHNTIADYGGAKDVFTAGKG